MKKLFVGGAIFTAVAAGVAMVIHIRKGTRDTCGYGR